MHKTIGVLGGMGPEATLVFYRYLIHFTPAPRDQDHIPVIIYSQPRIPDRTDFLLKGGESPLPLLKVVARRLEQAGAELIAIPCNTAHVFWKETQESVQIPVLNIIQETVRKIGLDLNQGCSVGILSTKGTLKTELYQKALTETGFLPMTPNNSMGDRIQTAIYRVKSGDTGNETRRLVQDSIHEYHKAGADAVILGCTELGVVAEDSESPILVYDSLKILAGRTVESAMV